MPVRFSIVLACATVRSSGSPVAAVVRPLKVCVATSARSVLPTAFAAIFALVTELFDRVAAKLSAPVPVTSPVSVMVWSPVFVPDRLLALIAPASVSELPHCGAVPSEVITVFAAPIARVASELVESAYRMSPTTYDENPVPPCDTPTVPPATTVQVVPLLRYSRELSVAKYKQCGAAAAAGLAASSP